MGRWLFFFFQAEDGIRDVAVTGVQTCALPIWNVLAASWQPAFCETDGAWTENNELKPECATQTPDRFDGRSEERRVGKECRSRWSPDRRKKNRQPVCQHVRFERL